MINLTYPDGSNHEFAPGINGLDIANSIAKSLAKKAVAIALDDEIYDLSYPVTRDGAIRIICRDDPEALPLIRHDCAHVMAEAVQELWPQTQVTIGPAIDDGFYYDFARDTPFTSEELETIEAKMREIIKRNEPFTKEIWSRQQAIDVFKAKGEHFKVELIESIADDEEIRVYKQGKWFDLCRGPHMPATGMVGTSFKLTKVAGAYWRGDAKNPMLSRIYGTAWANDKDLKAYIHRLEEAKKRDHRRLGRDMDLFHFQEEGPGVVFWHPKGWLIFNQLLDYMRRRRQADGYVEVNTPQLLDRALWEASGHWDKYYENMFITQTEDDRIFALKPMSCPGHVQIFSHGLRSYRELPLKLAEFGKVHRYEPSGSLHGLMRVRGMTQDDSHVFIREDQILDECVALNNLILSIYSDIGFDDITIHLSTRPEQRIGDDAIWDKAEESLLKVIQNTDREWQINEGDGAFYGPKLDYLLNDSIGRQWQCGTIQLDFNLSQRLGAFYIGSDGDKHTPILIHCAILGSLERFMGILIEHYAGKLPLWLAPVQVAVLTITSAAEEYAEQVFNKLKASGIRAELDIRNEKINYKIREASLAKTPIMFICGGKEAENNTVSIRELSSNQQRIIDVEQAITDLAGAITPPDKI